MIVLDVETTGTNATKHSLVSIGAVDTDNIEDKFYEECRIWEGAHVDPVALKINGMSEKEINDTKRQTEGEIVEKFLGWFEARKNKIIAGQNPFMDVKFIMEASDRWNLDCRLQRRTIDQHTVCYMHMLSRKETPPLNEKGKSAIDSDFIMKYVGIPPEPKPHIGINGAIWEAEALSRMLHNKNLFPEFENYPIPWS